MTSRDTLVLSNFVDCIYSNSRCAGVRLFQISAMHLSTFLAVLFVALCSVGITEAGLYGVDCECLCCVPDQASPCNPTDIGSIHLNSTVCDKKQCVDSCATIFFTCEDPTGTIDAGCSDS